MIEMAAHIPPRAVLQIVEHFGGNDLYVPVDPRRGKLDAVIGPDLSDVMSQVYGPERLKIPCAKHALAHARRSAVIAATRADKLSLTEAARILRTSRNYVAELIKAKDELWVAPAPIARRGPSPHPGQLALFDRDEAA